MSDTKEFVDGLIAKKPHEKAPDFIKASISIKRKDLGNWLRGKDDDWINVDIKEAKSGKWYAEVNNWTPDNTQSGADSTQNVNDSSQGQNSGGGDFDRDIPFAKVDGRFV